MPLKVVYENKPVGVEGNVTNSASEQMDFVDLTELDRENDIKHYGTLEGDNWLLTDDVLILPDDLESIDLGYVSEQISDASGNFASPITITRTYNGSFSAPGISLTFDTYNGLYGKNVNIKWYRDSTLLYDNDYEIDKAVYFAEQNVVAFNKVVITFTNVNKPSRYLRIFKIDDGVIREFYKDEIVGLTITENISDTGESLQINTMDLKLISKSNVKILWQRVQALKVYNNSDYYGTFFVESADRTGNSYDLTTYDLVGMLDNTTHYGGIYSNASASLLIADIMKDIPYELDDELASEVLTGYLPIDKARNNLMQVAFAINAVVDTSRTDKVRIYPMPLYNPSNVTIIDEERAGNQVSEKINAPVTRIELTTHKYVYTNEDASELYNDVLNGSLFVNFGAPYYNLSISGGTIIDSGTNYALISGTGGTVVLSGYNYNDEQTVLSVDNPLNTNNTIPNLKSINTATLVNSSNAASILTRLSEALFNNSTLDVKFILGDEKVGDYIQISTDEGDKIGQILKLQYELINNVIYTSATIREVNNGN